MKAVIIAGGLGTRMRPLTYNRPKPVVSVANRPFVAYQIELLKRYGITEIILNLHYLPKNMELLLGDGRELGVKLIYSIEKTPLGTAGAVKNAERFFDDEPLIVFNGDVLTDIDISELVSFHKKNKAKATIALTEVEDPTAFGLVIADDTGRVSSFLEKPSWEEVTTKNINAGIYILDPSIFKDVPSGRPYSFERELFPGLIEKGQNVFAKASEAYWLDIGSPKKYMQAHKDILNGEVSVNIDGKDRGGNTWVHPSADISPTAKLRGPLIIGNKARLSGKSCIKSFSVIGENVSLEEGSVVEDTIILRNSKIGRDVRLKNCIIGENCIIEDFVEMIYGVVLADYSIVKKGSKLL
ncbi:MAG: NDP-sugar synthase [Candidatus Margulisiibacteriota bacterium]